MGEIDGDEFTDLLKKHGWGYNDDGELKKFIEDDEFEKYAKMTDDKTTARDLMEYMRLHPGKTFEEAIISDFGDQSVQAKQYGFGVFKKSTD